jgi:hypothetical protein
MVFIKAYINGFNNFFEAASQCGMVNWRNQKNGFS